MIDVEVRGLKELQRKTDQMVRDLHGAPMLNAMRDSTMQVMRLARKNTPVDTGKLQASILPEIRATQNEVMGVVGSNVKYAPYVELDTRPHWPPIAALEVWAARHGRSAFYVARLISIKGTKGKHMLENAFKDSEGAINRRFERAVSEVVEK